MKHKGTDYKISAVRHYLNNKSLSKTRKIFGCSKGSLHRWSLAYKIRNEQVKTALDKIDKNEQFTMTELLVDLKNHISTLLCTRFSIHD